jgi:glycerophosphoryl diester phosphodiesterase
MNIEVKLDPTKPTLTPSPAEFARLLVTDLDRTGMRTRVIVQCFDWRVVVETLAIAPEVVTAALTEQQGSDDTMWIDRPGLSPWLAGMDPTAYGRSVPRMVSALGARIWAPDYLDLDAAKVADAHALGLGVLPWTVNAAEAMAHMLDIGVDGIITDRPDRLRAVLAAHGRPLPPAGIASQ